MRHWPPSSITTDQLGSYPKAISRLQREGKLSSDAKHRSYLAIQLATAAAIVSAWTSKPRNRNFSHMTGSFRLRIWTVRPYKLTA
jgi:hypothetical protein